MHIYNNNIITTKKERASINYYNKKHNVLENVKDIINYPRKKIKTDSYLNKLIVTKSKMTLNIEKNISFVINGKVTQTSINTNKPSVHNNCLIPNFIEEISITNCKNIPCN